MRQNYENVGIYIYRVWEGSGQYSARLLSMSCARAGTTYRICSQARHCTRIRAGIGTMDQAMLGSCLMPPNGLGSFINIY